MISHRVKRTEQPSAVNLYADEHFSHAASAYVCSCTGYATPVIDVAHVRP
jgi:hypothetical protein